MLELVVVGAFIEVGHRVFCTIIVTIDFLTSDQDDPFNLGCSRLRTNHVCIILVVVYYCNICL